MACELYFEGSQARRDRIAPSFLYRPFCRVLQRIQLISRRDMDLAIEAIMLHHQVAVLRRQAHRPML
ncbi:MAG: hypothetical protein ACYCTL_10840 [Acidimicrobiales bacterium]